MRAAPLQAPFPYFGGKSRVAGQVWQRFGTVKNYVEPFFGSGAMLLARPESAFPDTATVETVNDADAMVANFWRALRADPEQVAYHADWPVNETDLHARHVWLLGRKPEIESACVSDPDYYDAKAAGWWVWGMSAWIGGGFCSGSGPWQLVDGVLTDTGNAGRGVHRQRPHLGNAGQGVHRQLGLYDWLHALATRLANVRVCSGDWSRVTGPSVTHRHGLTAIFLDPPYSAEAQRDTVYNVEDFSIAHDVREWAIREGASQTMRIALCGYEREHGHYMPDDWECLAWKAQGGDEQYPQKRHQRQLQTGTSLVLAALPAWRARQVVVSCKLWK